jgi:hypothetical protein
VQEASADIVQARGHAKAIDQRDVELRQGPAR